MISLMFLPMNWIQSGLFILPSIVTFQWILFGRCVISKYDAATQDQNFTQKLLSYINIHVTKKTSSNLTAFGLTVVPTVLFYRLMKMQSQS